MRPDVNLISQRLTIRSCLEFARLGRAIRYSSMYVLSGVALLAVQVHCYVAYGSELLPANNPVASVGLQLALVQFQLSRANGPYEPSLGLRTQ